MVKTPISEIFFQQGVEFFGNMRYNVQCIRKMYHGGEGDPMISRKKILVVEDNELNRDLLALILSQEYDVLKAENGAEALDVLKQYGEAVSLILLDIVMPVMDGYTFLSIVKKDPAYSSIPVIVTTQNDSEADEVNALAHGAADFVPKPYRSRIIMHRVASIIHLRETAAMVNLIKYDRLTGLYGKEYFYQKVRDTLIQYPDKQFDIICSDIENFKLFNDVFGNTAGDELLCSVAELYTEKVGDKGVCGRLDSDRFACLIESRKEYAEEFFVDTLKTLNQMFDAGNVTMRWGIYTVQDRNLSIEQMCDRSVLAARSIKGQYGRYYARYDDNLRSKLLHEQAITDCMEGALAEGQFVIYLQPKFRIIDSQLSGAEVLVRWIHPEWGLMSPAEFIPLFEQNGFITKLDQYVWDQACKVLKQWDDAGYEPLTVSVNVSRADIYHVDLPEIIKKTVEKYSLSPKRLHLEITESAYTDNPKQIVEAMDRLREQGFIIEMDDFGSGYSSLNMLSDLPIDVLKLDMGFVRTETEKPRSKAILKFIVDLARWMKLNVVAEGVETEDQLARLKEIECDYAQGYFFAKPMPWMEFERLLMKKADKEG